MATVTLCSNQQNFPTSVIVVDNLAEEAILGLDFLDNYSCTIDVPQRRLALFLDTKPVFINATSPQHRDLTLQATLCETVNVPPYSELETLSSVNSFSSQVGDWLLEDSLSGSKRINATTARAIISPNSHVVVCLINPTDTPVTIYKGTRVASITKLPQVNLSQGTAIPQNKKEVLWGIASNVTTLSDAEREQFYALLTSFADVFPINKDDLGRTGLLQHSIDTGSAPPIKQPPRRVPQHKQWEAQRLLQEMLDKNIISLLQLYLFKRRMVPCDFVWTTVESMKSLGRMPIPFLASTRL